MQAKGPPRGSVTRPPHPLHRNDRSTRCVHGSSRSALFWRRLAVTFMATTGVGIGSLLAHHQSGNWGDLGAEDQAANARALVESSATARVLGSPSSSAGCCDERRTRRRHHPVRPVPRTADGVRHVYRLRCLAW